MIQNLKNVFIHPLEGGGRVGGGGGRKGKEKLEDTDSEPTVPGLCYLLAGPSE